MTGAVFIDSVDHKIMVNKLRSFGVYDTELQWFHSYLTDRKQFVSFGKAISDPCDISFGVPQGSILGPLLFVNDIRFVIKSCQILMYADDTVIYNTAKDQLKISNTLSKELAIINQWLLENTLYLHKGKTECVLFGTSPRLARTNNFTVAIDKTCIAI